MPPLLRPRDPTPLNSIKEAPLHPERKSVRWSGATSDLGMKQVMP